MHVSGTPSHRRPAFTLVELLVVITIIVLLVAILLPSLSSSMARAKRVACLSSMKHTTFGLNMFAEEHANRYPWAVKAAEGGAAPSEFVYPYFAAAAGELGSPRILVCASDGDRKKAASWSANPGGLASAGFQDSSVSYQIGLEAVKNVRGMLLLADRDLKGANGNCGIINYLSSGIITTGLGGNATWTGKLHRGGGNISLADGSVQMVDNKQLSVVLKDQMNSAADPNLSNCTLKPGGAAAQGAVVP
jgi:prepilin-type N-terminal cleavage/methylation domain-containing protein/prepilin-type processing-associated H-X9-DG protein